MNFSYLLYEAERVKGAREQREADVRAGELAQTLARLFRSVLPARRQPALYETGEHEAIRQPCVAAER
ncbi:MAG TPA: hypothetical protein VGG83_11710 [Trebonia sp.]|jgi:hypothetical protein